MSILDFIRKQILRYRDLLANMSRKNKELYYRESRANCINLSKLPQVEDEFSEIISERFFSLKTESQHFQKIIDQSSLNLSEHFLIDQTNNLGLVKRLDKIRLADEKFQKEYGISGAWLLGPFLCWRDNVSYKKEDLLVSPIFKIPVGIKKNKSKKWFLEIEDNTLEINPSLILALRQKWGVNLPETFETNDVSAILNEIKQSIEFADKKIHYDTTLNSVPKIPPRYKFLKNEAGEITERIPVNLDDFLSKKDLDLYNKVTHKDFYIIDIALIDHLNASRAVLIKDYDKIFETENPHPILSELFLGKPVAGNDDTTTEAMKQLDSYKESLNHFVVNIDSSQHRAIDQVSKNNVVVIQGPPGTGKSQTITNLIADAVTKGKKVLFVSEKRAALDVVYSRMQQAKIENQAVLIHSSDLNKQKLYNNFLELSNNVSNQEADQEWVRTTDLLDKIKSEINQYYKALSSTHDSSGLLVSDLLSFNSEIKIEKINLPLAKQFVKIPFFNLKNVCQILDKLQSEIYSVTDFASHPWRYKKKSVVLTSTFKQEIEDGVCKILESEDKLSVLYEKLNTIGIDKFDVIPDIAALQLANKIDMPKEWHAFANTFYLDENVSATYKSDVLRLVDIIKNEWQHFENISPGADIEIIKQLESYYSVKRSPIDYFSSNFYRMKSYKNQCIKTWDGSNQSFKSYRIVFEAMQSFNAILQNRTLPFSVTIENLRILLDKCNDIFEIIESASEFGRCIKKLGLQGKNEFLRLTPETLLNIKKLISDLLEIKSSYDAQKNELSERRLELHKFFECEIEVKNYDQLIEKLTDLYTIDKIYSSFDELQFNLNFEWSKQEIIDAFLSINSSWGEYIYSSVLHLWLDDVISQYSELRGFSKESFQSKIDHFKQLEDQHRITARDFVNNAHPKRWNRGIGESIGLRLLKRAAGKQRGILSPREIMEKGAISTMMKLKPCWLMSPLSISQIMPMQSGIFDLIIFDEASQVRVEDAVPSIYRAKSMVVVGDPKQMPPTNFFSSNDSEDEDDDSDTEIAHSILDLATQIYPTQMLEWHYRSRSEALIAFSNRAFYGGRLIAVPNPHFMTEGDAISFHQVNEAFFTQKQGNPIEAEAIVDRLYDLLKTYQNHSIGIIAMGQSHMSAIEDAIQKRTESNKVFKDLLEQSINYFDGDSDAGFFVKNLENVQGDERDIIIIAIGYAPSSPGKKLYMNFGPLSKQGGGRRLNVAITRAKKRIEVFCSFNPEQMQTAEKDFEKNPDLALLGRYLKYAFAISRKSYLEAKSLFDSFGVGGAITSRKSSSFSKDVKRRLEEIGYIVSAEIGSSGFYIDLGIHHPVIQSNFVLGIECDGAFFHSHPYARDRDKIRQELLESRGWKIERIWSQDWSRDWKNEINKIDIILKGILNTANVTESMI
ncbi:MAG: AAA domain-containing protein [Gammaproteobacteria bacterium]|nr:AAA domain-containing protein [Gammaproteobacteria bacterium]